MNILVWKGLRSMIFRGSRPCLSRWYASHTTNLGSPGTENMNRANLSVLFFCSVRLLASTASAIFCWMMNTVSCGSRKIFSVVSSGEPSASFFRMTKDTQKWLRL